MRKFVILLAAIALMLMVIAPVFAQEVALLDVARDTEELSSFMSLVEAANIMNSLSRGGHFTIFAPNNAAWDALPARLGMSMDELLANPALLRQILRYHIVAQQYSVVDLSTQLDEESHRFLRTVEGSQILVTGNENGLFLNENLLLRDTGASIVTSDIFAANGVLHVIDSVLLPPPNVIDSAQIRLAHLMPDAPLLDVYINGELSSIQPLAYTNVSGWVEVPTGQYEIAFVPAGAGYEEALMSPLIVDLAPNDWVTITASGSVEAQTAQAQAVTEELDRPLFEEMAHLTVFYDVAETNAIMVLANEDIIIPNLLIDENLGGSESLDLPAGTYNLQFVNADESQSLILSVTIELQADTANLVTITGSQAEPEVLVEVTEMDELDEIVNLILPPGR